MSLFLAILFSVSVVVQTEGYAQAQTQSQDKVNPVPSFLNQNQTLNETEKTNDQVDSEQSHNNEKGATQEEATQQEATQEEATQEEATQEETTQEETTQEEATQEEATQQEATQQEATQEEATQQEQNQSSEVKVEQEETLSQDSLLNQNISSEEIKSLSEKVDPLARTVRFELEEIQNSKGYDIEVISSDKRWNKKHKFRISDNKLRLRLTPGKYKVRTRTYNQDEFSGSWSEWLDFNVHFRIPTEVYPQDAEVIKPIGEKAEKITFEWVTTPGAIAYLFELKDANGDYIEKKLINSYYKTMTLEVNSKYSWAITPLKTIEEANAPDLFRKFQNFEISRPAENLTPIFIDIEKRRTAVRYEMEFQKKIGEGKFSQPTIYESVLPEFRGRLDPGAYEMRVRAIYDDKSKSAWGPPTPFYVPFTSAVAKSPREGFFSSAVVESDHPTDVSVDIKWKEVPGAELYVLYVYDDIGEIIQKHETQKLIHAVVLEPGARYHYHIQAYSKGEPRRKPPEVGDRTYPFAIKRYVPIALLNVEEPSDLYGWLNYHTSKIKYRSESYDQNSLTENTLDGGSGEAAVGFWHRKSKFGALAFYNMSGFSLRGDYFFYDTYGAQIGYRYFYSKRSRLRMWVGMAKKSIPQLITIPNTSVLDVKNVESTGYYFQATYMEDINTLYGWYLLGSYYRMGAGMESTPNGLELKHMDSLHLGVYLTRVFQEKYRLRLGYAFKDEKAVYPTNSQVYTSDNQVRIYGHYISLLFEFALRDDPVY